MAEERDQWTGCRFETLRRRLDPPFLALVAELEQAYYGPRDETGRFTGQGGWRNGFPADFYGHDPIADPTEGDPKALFDSLHGMIWCAHEVLLIAEGEKNNRLPHKDKLNPPSPNGVKRSDELTVRLTEFRSLGIGQKLPLKAKLDEMRTALLSKPGA